MYASFASNTICSGVHSVILYDVVAVRVHAVEVVGHVVAVSVHATPGAIGYENSVRHAANGVREVDDDFLVGGAGRDRDRSGRSPMVDDRLGRVRRSLPRALEVFPRHGRCRRSTLPRRTACRSRSSPPLEAGAVVSAVAAVVAGPDASVVAGADDDSDDASAVWPAAAVVAGACSELVALPPPESSSSPHAAATNARPTAIAAIRLVRLLITWILLIESQREVVLPLSGARRAVHAVST